MKSVVFKVSLGAVMALGCSMSEPTREDAGAKQNLRTIRLQVDGFKKSKSGAT